jgi:3'(2'), 5'-bisphosphate nucleotidase
MTDAELAADLAQAAGRLLLAIQARGGAAAARGSAGDTAANRFLVAELRRQRPDDGLLSEEMKCDGARLDKARVWIIDPVDGTREFGEGRSDWAVHVGLSIDGDARVGAVALPGQGLMFRSDTPAALPPLPPRARMVVSRSRPAREALAIAEALDAATIPMGSAGAKAMAVVRGDADIYLHSGGQYEWDNCAPVAVAAAHGLHVSRLNGASLRYNGGDPYVPDLLICRPEWAARVLALTASSG